MKCVLIFCIISGILLCADVSPLFAKAPSTPKILFSSARDGNGEIYIMNPDGSEQINLTQHPANDLKVEQHTPAEVEAVFKHFQEGELHSHSGSIRPGDGVSNTVWESNLVGREAPAEMRKTDMKKNLRGKIREFVQSEEGRVGVKSPLTLGIGGT